ncbi:hypothetical protein [uncultured Aquimarina sp.]|uniref:hypothetical protein n=1 Tax=uncultured Aquimarina sp. TaxID=575652 RepID=UPI002601EBF3|nr:hypothetical protein [uncultured Aquimarina sp.]
MRTVFNKKKGHELEELIEEVEEVEEGEMLLSSYIWIHENLEKEEMELLVN